MDEIENVQSIIVGDMIEDVGDVHEKVIEYQAEVEERLKVLLE